MSVDFAVSQKAPVLPIDLSVDVVWAFEKFSRVYGGKPMTQAALKALQALPLVCSALSVKERGAMSKNDREYASSKCMQELAVPGFIKLVAAVEEQRGEPLSMPHKWKDMIYFTTLGSGTSKAYTFMQKQATVLTKFGSAKADNTKVYEFFDKHDMNEASSDSRSGKNSVDNMQELNDHMYFQSPAYLRAIKKAGADTDADTDEFLAPRESAAEGSGSDALGDTSAGTTPPADDVQPAGAGGVRSAAAELAAAAAANLRKETEAAGAGDEPEDDVPDWYFFPYLLLAAAYSPWSGNTPSEWKHLESSSGPKKRKTGEITLDGGNPLCNPTAMARVNSNGDAFSRRQHAAAVKKEKDLEKKEASDEENKKARQAALVAMQTANAHAKTIGDSIVKMTSLKQKEYEKGVRRSRIEALEKKMMLGLGDVPAVRLELLKMLDEAFSAC